MTAFEMDFETHLSRFGIESFRPGQEEVVRAVLAGEHCLCVMPTGGGKSLCYQLPALMLEGLTLVVSPLIALMKDQVDQLRQRDIPVTYINSTLAPEEISRRLDGLQGGEYRLVYVVPERFRSPRFMDAVRRVGVQLLAIDEAHCISEWGHDFRPDYARLGHFRRLLGSPTTIALTATATDAVRHDILEQLSLSDARTFIRGFARENLFYRALQPQSETSRDRLLIEFLQRTSGSGIIYASSRKKTEEIAARIREETSRATIAYHAGLASPDRHHAQEAFMRGEAEIVVATTAFGMGIDKADVRFVVHYNLPGTLEGYYQEAGRAGRDGRPSTCLLLYHASDRRILEYFIESANPSRETIQGVYEFLRHRPENPIELTQEEIKEAVSLSIGSAAIGACEQMLESAGVLERLIASENRAVIRLDSEEENLVDLLPRNARTRRRVLAALEWLVGPRRHEIVYFLPAQLEQATEMSWTQLRHALRELNSLAVVTYVPPFRGRAIRMLDRETPFHKLQIDFAAAERLKAAEYEKLNQVVRFARSNACRQAVILRYFGESDVAACGHCDNCEMGGVSAQPTLPPEAVTVVRKALSGVARAQTRIRCGKGLVAQMLAGSKSVKMKQLGLQSLSTFGLLGQMSQVRIGELLTALIDADYVATETLPDVVPPRTVLRLTPSGECLMKDGTEAFSLPLSVELCRELGFGESGARAPDAAEDQPSAEALGPESTLVLERLKQWRSDVARSRGVPVYRVFSNATLEEIARTRPKSADDLLAVKGVGPRKLRSYGDAVLEQVHPVPAVPAPEPPPTEEREGAAVDVAQSLPTNSAHPDHYWTWRLLKAGFSPDECAAIRGTSVDAVLRQAARAAAAGLDIKLRWCLSEETVVHLEAWAERLEASGAAGGDVELPSDVDRTAWDIFRRLRPRRD